MKNVVLACAVAALSVLYVIAVRALPNNPAVYPGFYAAVLHKSNKPGYTTSGNGCGAASGCHGAVADSTITAALSGPSSLYPGQTGTYTLTTSKSVANGVTAHVGFDIGADDANALGLVGGEPTALVADPSNSAAAPEITHVDTSGMRTITSANATVTHQFDFTMPAAAAVGSTHSLYAVTAVGFTGGYKHASNFAVATTTPPPASDLVITNLTGTSFTASWGGAPPEFRAIYKADALPSSPTDGTLIVEGASTTGNASGLTPNRRYFVAVYGKASGSSTYSAAAVSTSIVMPASQVIDPGGSGGSGRTADTNQGQLLFVDDPTNTNVVKLYNGSTILTIEAKGTGGFVDFDDFGMGNGATPGHTIAVWRRGTDQGHYSVDGAPSGLITAVNPNSTDPMNLEGQAIADGCAYIVEQSFVGTTAVKNVYKLDPSTGNAGNAISNVSEIPGVSGRVRTSDCKAAWAWNDGTTTTVKYYDGSTVRTVGTGSTPWLAHGRLVYVGSAGGVNQVFLYDTTTASPAPQQLTHYTDPTMGITSVQTDGRHVVWFRNNAGNTAPEIDAGNGSVVIAAPAGQLSQMDAPFELNRGQLLWVESTGKYRYDTLAASTVLPLAATTSRPWLVDGSIGYGDTAAPNSMLFSGSAPADTAQPAPPIVVQVTSGTGTLTLNWDAILGATSYTVYYANQAGVTKANYATLVGGTRITGLTSPTYTLSAAANLPYYFVVTTTDATGEGPESRQASGINISAASWTSVGGLSSTAMWTVAADRTQLNVAYAAGGNNTYVSSDGGFTWSTLGGGIAGANVRALYANNGRVLATVPAGSIYASTNGGTTWTTMLAASGVGETNQEIVVDPAVPTTILASDFQLSTFNGGLNDSYIIRSDDGGATWFHTPQSADTLLGYSLAFDPTRTSTIYAGGPGAPNLAQSLAGGAGWNDEAIPASGSTAGYVYTIAVDPTNSRVLYAGIEQAFGSGSKGVYKSTDGGATWTLMNTGLTGPPGVRSLVIDPADHNVIHAGTESGYFYSLNGGASWAADNTGLSTASAQFIYALAMTQSHRLVAATGAGLFVLNLGAVPAPAVSSVSPNTGPTTGATAVTITGAGFEPGATVTFGGTAATNVSVVNATTITATTPAHAAAAVNVVVTNGDGQSATLTNGFTYATVVAPANLVATAQTTTSVLLTWSPVAGAATYEIARSASGLSFTVVNSSATNSFTDTVAASTAYLYEVRAVDGASNRSAYSNMDLATTVIFTNDPLIAGATVAKVVHINELRTAVDAVRRLAGSGAFSYTDPTLTAGMPIKAAHVTDLRTALNAARATLTLPPIPYTDPTITPGVTVMKAAHLQELRNGVK